MSQNTKDEEEPANQVNQGKRKAIRKLSAHRVRYIYFAYFAHYETSESMLFTDSFALSC